MTRSRLRDDAREVDRLLRAIRGALRRPIESEIAKGRLTAPQLAVMGAIAHAEAGLALKDLAAAVGLSHSTVSGIVDRLLGKGWLDRHTDAVDARRTRIVLSPSIREYVRTRLSMLTLSPLAAALGRMSPRERQMLLASLTRLTAALRAVESVPRGDTRDGRRKQPIE